jgi:hypothetical protein
MDVRCGRVWDERVKEGEEYLEERRRGGRERNPMSQPSRRITRMGEVLGRFTVVQVDGGERSPRPA